MSGKDMNARVEVSELISAIQCSFKDLTFSQIFKNQIFWIFWNLVCSNASNWLLNYMATSNEKLQSETEADHVMGWELTEKIPKNYPLIRVRYLVYAHALLRWLILTIYVVQIGAGLPQMSVNW